MSPAQQLDLSGAVGRLVASVLFGLAEIEQEYRRERQAAGIAVAKRKGRYHGRAEGTTKARLSALAYCLSVASPWRRFRRPCRSVHVLSTALWPQRRTRELFTGRV
ncbi:MAG TPA: recombinase family protein [Candidatus Tectomicrobia bacterium]